MNSPKEEARPPEQTVDEAEAQRAADALKGQIAAVRARIKDARKTLREGVKREQEPKSFKR